MLGEGIQSGGDDGSDSCGDRYPWRDLSGAWRSDAQHRPEDLHVKGSRSMNPEQALQKVGTAERPLEPFRYTLAKQALKLERGKTTTLQINLGRLCNQTCRHCHMGAGAG